VVGQPGSNWIAGWSPDRRRLIFFSDRKGTPGIWSVTVGSGAGDGGVRELAPNVGRWEPLGITHAGALLYRNEADAQDVYTAVLDLQAGTTVSPPKQVMDRFLGSYGPPNWSEDGRLLVFTSSHAGPRQATVVIYDRETGAKRELPIELARMMRPQWSSHGAEIMAIGESANGEDGQYRIDPKTGKAKLFMTRKDLEVQTEGTWSSDGRVYFNRYADWRRGIFRLDARTHERRVLYVPPPGIDLATENLSLSPDGHSLAFHARNDAAGTASLMLAPSEGGDAKMLFTIQQPERFLLGSFTWTPDSKNILAARTRDSVSEIWQVPVNGASPSKIDFPYPMRILCLRLNADGRSVAFERLEYRSEIWMLQNFL
jgi:Tol biopolymer transport system component